MRLTLTVLTQAATSLVSKRAQGAGDAGVVDQNVDSSEPLHGSGSQPLDLGLAGHVGRDGDSQSADFGHRGHGLLKFRLVAGRDHHACAFPCKRDRNDPANTTSRAGNHRNFVLQFHKTAPDFSRSETVKPALGSLSHYRQGYTNSPWADSGGQTITLRPRCHCTNRACLAVGRPVASILNLP